MHFYTSININYLPKARILAKSIKKYCPGSKFSLVFSDVLPDSIEPEKEPFDEIVTILELGLPVENLDLWIYQHTVVELCTAVKGQALLKFLEEGSDKVVYLDPDIAVFDDLDCLNKLMDKYDIILTPHVTIPEDDELGIWDNEICALKHGTFNFGFYAVKNSNNGLAFTHWWRDRLISYCHDNIPEGLFTDQRWGDLAPCLFEGVYIWKDAGCNVATWNISNRIITKDNNNIFFVNGSKLKFYHFSGFDSGSQATMLDRYSHGNSALYELRKWYIDRQKEEEQNIYEKYPSKYNFYDNGIAVERDERVLFRNRLDIINFFEGTNPYIVNQERSYYYWYRDETNQLKTIEQLLEEAKKTLEISEDNTKIQSKQIKTLQQSFDDTKNTLVIAEEKIKSQNKQIELLNGKLEKVYNSKIGWLIDKIIR